MECHLEKLYLTNYFGNNFYLYENYSKTLNSYYLDFDEN